MTKSDALETLYKLEFTAGLSQFYYRKLVFWLALVDRLLKIGLGLATVFGLAFSFSTDATLAAWNFYLAVFSAVSAVLLNVLPVDAFERKFAAFQARWKEFQNDIQSVALDIFDRTIDARYYAAHKGRLTDEVSSSESKNVRRLIEWKHSIDAEEKFDIGFLNRRAQCMEYQRWWGKDVKTGEGAKRRFNEYREEFDRSNALVPSAATA